MGSGIDEVMSRATIAAIAVLALIVAVLTSWFMLRRGETLPAAIPERIVQQPGPPVTRAIPRTAEARPMTLPPLPSPEAGTDEFADDPIEGVWEGVDLDAARAALPENRYWTLAMPTDDPKVLEARAERRERLRAQYDKLLSGTGTEEEILAYYDERAELSGDYVELTAYLIEHNGESLSEDDLERIYLARRLHHARLEETPRKIDEAIARKRARDAAQAPPAEHDRPTTSGQ